MLRLNDRPERSGADFVLYWIQMNHWAEQNWALTAAVEEANRLGVPLIVYHGLGHTYPYANDRIHRFVLAGVAELAERFERQGVRYLFYLRRYAEDPNDILNRLARRATPRSHAKDRRSSVYTPEEFESARTHDYLWNAVQAELLTTGAMFGYYRMYWGKKIIEWSRTPAEAQETRIRLHEKHALHGRNPNTYANIL